MIHYVESPVIKPKKKVEEIYIKESKTKSKAKLPEKREIKKNETKNISSFGKLNRYKGTIPIFLFGTD